MENPLLVVWERMGGSGSPVTRVSVQRRASLGCCNGVCPFRQLVWKLKSCFKRDLGWKKRSSSRFSYDIQSYSLNFEDGFIKDHLSFHVSS